MTSNQCGYFTFTCPGTVADAPVDSFEAEAIIKSYHVQLRVADSEQCSIVFDATSRQWEKLAGQAILNQVLASKPAFGLRLRLPISLMFVAFPTIQGLEIVDGSMTIVLENEVPVPKPDAFQPLVNNHQNTNRENISPDDAEYEIDEDLEDEFAETQRY